MTRGGRDTNRDEPERRCIVTGDVQPKAGLVRFVVSPEGMVVPDLAGKLPGRGIWVTADRTAIETAAKKGLFSRAARMPVTVPEGLAGLVEKGRACRGRVREGQGLARRWQGQGSPAGLRRI
jgi:predicted RNA-binding protein YlxR (DUF448 family)